MAAIKTQKKNSSSKSHDVSCVRIAETIRMESRMRSPGSIKRFSKVSSEMRFSKEADPRHTKINSAGSGSVRFQLFAANTR